MSAESSKSPISVNGWIAAVLLTLLVFLFYYGFNGGLYISLAQQWEKNFWFQANDTEGTCKVFLKGPKYVVDFTENEFTLVFQNSGGASNKSNENSCRGSLRIIANVEPETSILIPIEVVEVEAANQPKRTYTQQFTVEYDLNEFETKTILFRLLVPPEIYGLKRQVSLTLKDKELDNKSISWEGDNTTTACKSQENVKEKICFNVDLINAIRESVIRNLLLPPWSNRLLPFVVFAMVWLVEQVLPNKKAWSEQPNFWLLVLVILGGYFLFLLFAALHFILLVDGAFLAGLLYMVLLVLLAITLPKLFSWTDKWSVPIRVAFLIIIAAIPVLLFFLKIKG